jgi:hypothetical protein
MFLKGFRACARLIAPLDPFFDHDRAVREIQVTNRRNCGLVWRGQVSGCRSDPVQSGEDGRKESESYST